LDKNYADINGALDRMQELEAQNELILLDQQRFKDEIVNYQQLQKVAKSKQEDMEESIKGLERKRAEDARVIKELEVTICAVNDDLERQAEQAKRLADLNEELRKLFEEERKAMADEHEKLEHELEQMHHTNERKQQMLRSKLFVLISAFSVGREIRSDRERTTVDEMFKELQEIAHGLHLGKKFESKVNTPKPLEPPVYSQIKSDYQPVLSAKNPWLEQLA
jgi:uncharacterized coiled-coil protein SlyX